MARVLLLNPPAVDGIRYTREGRCQERESVLGTVKPPLSLAILAALLRKEGHTIELVDATACDLSTDQVMDLLPRRNFHPDIAVLATTTPTILSDMETARQIKERFGSLLVAIGPHTSGIPRETLQEFSWLDVAIVGEPELAVAAICRDSSPSHLRQIQGVCFRDGEEIVASPFPARVPDLDQLPGPAWDLLPLGRYRLPVINEPYVLVETSRGCPPSCDFCVVTLTHGKAFRQRSTEKIIGEIEDVYARHGVKHFYLWGDTVTMGRAFLQEFAREVRNRSLPIRWMGNTRVDTLPSFEFAQELKAAGCWMLSVGVESGDDDVRRTMSKKFKSDRIKQVFGWLRHAGILSFAFFILGYLGEDRDKMEKTINLAIDIDPDYAAFYPAVPYPGTAFHRECVARGWLGTKDWSKYDYSNYVIENHVLRPEIVLPMKTIAYRRFYLRPRVLFRNLKMIRSRAALGQMKDWGLTLVKNGGIARSR